MKVIYIAGPYRNKSEYEVGENIRIAAEFALAVWRSGGVALCPHKNTAFFGGAYNLPDDTWLKGDLELLSRCDAVLAVTGWITSSGTVAEISFAHERKIPVFYTIFEVQKFLEITTNLPT